MELTGSLRAMSYAVVDLETTGLDPTHDRVVEVAVAVLRPGARPVVVFDTLIDPGRSIPLASTKVHGICDADVAAAPRFSKVAPALLALFANRVVAGHNAVFDVRFLEAELARAGHAVELPFLCTMGLPALLSGGPANRPLWWAAAQLGVPTPPKPHTAATDALAAARVLAGQLERAGQATFESIRRSGGRRRSPPAFVRSLSHARLPAAAHLLTAHSLPLRSRTPCPASPTLTPSQRYLRAVLSETEDLVLAPDALRRLQVLQQGLPPGEADRVHAKVWRVAMDRFLEDGHIDPRERVHAERLRGCLTALGAVVPPPG